MEGFFAEQGAPKEGAAATGMAEEHSAKVLKNWPQVLCTALLKPS
jgi:hypothetical protein